MDNIERFYEEYDEWERLERHQVEFSMTKRMLDKHVPKGASVLDVGGGPGRYTIYLAQKGYDITLVDLSQRLVDQAKRKAEESGVNVCCVKGNALELELLFPGDSFDAVLCMGPVYHLVEESDRVKAVEQCLRLLKAGGTLIVSFISAYAAMTDCLRKHPQEIRNLKHGLLRYIEDGRHSAETGKGFTDAYFINPVSIGDFMSQFNLETLRIMAVDGPGILAEDKLIGLDKRDFESWLDVFEEISGRREVWGSCEHMLYIGRKTE